MYPWFDVLLLVLNLLATPLFGPPTFVFVRNTGPVPGELICFTLSSPESTLCLGQRLEVESVPSMEEGCAIKRLLRKLAGRPIIISLYVELGRIPIHNLIKTISLIRKGCPPGKNVVIVFRLAETPEPPDPIFPD